MLCGIKINRLIKTASFSAALFITVSISASFAAASLHLTHVGDGHDHALECPLRAFFDVIAVSFAFTAVLLITLVARRRRAMPAPRRPLHLFAVTAISRAPPLVYSA